MIEIATYYCIAMGFLVSVALGWAWGFNQAKNKYAKCTKDEEVKGC
jgi:hypothetical protein